MAGRGSELRPGLTSSDFAQFSPFIRENRTVPTTPAGQSRREPASRPTGVPGPVPGERTFSVKPQVLLVRQDVIFSLKSANSSRQISVFRTHLLPPHEVPDI